MCTIGPILIGRENSLMQETVIFPGTFDPITRGHVDLIKRTAKLFPHVIVGVAPNPSKTPIFSHEERLELAKKVLAPIKHITVIGFTGLLVDFAQEHGAKAIVRGLRGVADFEYEYQLAGMNRHLAPELETIFLTTAEQYSFVAANLVREVAALGGDVSPFVHEEVAIALRERLSSK